MGEIAEIDFPPSNGTGPPERDQHRRAAHRSPWPLLLGALQGSGWWTLALPLPAMAEWCPLRALVYCFPPFCTRYIYIYVDIDKQINM